MGQGAVYTSQWILRPQVSNFALRFGSRVFREVCVPDFAWGLRGKGARERAFWLSCFACFGRESVGSRKPADRVW